MEPITISHVRSPALKDIVLKGKQDVKAAKEPDSSRLVDDVQKDSNILRFSVHKASGKIMVMVIDGSTGKVSREMPPSEILDVVARIDNMIGLIFDQKG